MKKSRYFYELICSLKLAKIKPNSVAQEKPTKSAIASLCCKIDEKEISFDKAREAMDSSLSSATLDFFLFLSIRRFRVSISEFLVEDKLKRSVFQSDRATII